MNCSARMNYFFHCECGNKVVVSRSQSGSQVPCVCGRTNMVPSLSKLLKEQPKSVEQRTSPPEFQVQAPASWLMGMSLFSVGCLALLIAFNIALLGSGVAEESSPISQGISSKQQILFRMTLEIVMLAMNVITFFGALSMSRLRNFGFARAAATIGLIPFLSPCVFLGIPIAYSALATLGRPEVKQAFK
jgi:hypothetical protein